MASHPSSPSNPGFAVNFRWLYSVWKLQCFGRFEVLSIYSDFEKLKNVAAMHRNSPPSPGPPSPPSRLHRPRPDHRDETSRRVSPRCCRWWGWRGRGRNPFTMFLSLTIKNVGKFDLKYLKCDYVSVLRGDCREYVVRVWAHIGWNSQQRYESIGNFF